MDRWNIKKKQAELFVYAYIIYDYLQTLTFDFAALIRMS